MKTAYNKDRVATQDLGTGSATSRRQRTLAAFACESLEGRQLMTGGFGGPGGVMDMPRFAEMGTMDGAGNQDGQMPVFKHSRNEAAASTDATATGTASSAGTSTTADDAGTPGDGGTMHTFHILANDGGRDEGMGGGRSGTRGEIGDTERGGGRGNDGGMGMGMDDGPGGEARGDASMANQTQAGDDQKPATGNTQLDTDFQKLRTDEQAIHDKSEVTPKLLAAVRTDLQAIDKAKTGTADATALKTLQTDEQTIFAAKTTPTDAQRTQLQADRDAVLKSQGVSQTLIDQLAADRLAVKTASHFTADDQSLLDADHAAIEKDRAAAQPTADASTMAATSATATSTPDATAAASASTVATATPAAPTPDDAPTAAPGATSTSAPASTSDAPTATDPAISQNVRPTAFGGNANGGMNRTMGHHGRPMARSGGMMGQHASVNTGMGHRPHRSTGN